jgi:anti-anti-sigma regulatory factor
MPPPAAGRSNGLAALDFDAEALLDRESRVLLDPVFLASLHAEMEGELGDETASRMLLQMGFLHGLQDAIRALTRDAKAGALHPPLRIDCRVRRGDGPPGAIELEGCWPSGQEASGRVSALGASTVAICALSAGYTSGWLSGTLGADLIAVETECSATGRPVCRFVVREACVWRGGSDAAAAALADALPFDAIRELVRQRSAREQAAHRNEREAYARESDRIDRNAALVHIWGPVMVIPYSGPDEALAALELIGRDPSAEQVSVVVVDLEGVVVDDAFGAAALERIVKRIEGWGAEAIFVEPSPLSKQTLAKLDHLPLLVVKGLEQAIASALRVAQSQRQLL